MAYCGPTSMMMGLYYLYANGFTQLAPGPFKNQDDPTAINLERIISGLCNSSTAGGTNAEGIRKGMADYMSACGVAPDQYTVENSPNPNLEWIAKQIAPNFEGLPDAIVIANFSVGWFWRSGTVLENHGGNFLAPLSVDAPASVVILNNSSPSSFEDVPNEPSQNPQQVQIVALPEGWTLSGLPFPSQDYSEVISGNKGSNGDYYAILWSAQAWTISAAARPPTGSQARPAKPWVISSLKSINTNGGRLTVIAPLTGGGGLQKWGKGEIVLTSLSRSSSPRRKESWPRKSGQFDKWIFCLTPARLAEDQEIR